MSVDDLLFIFIIGGMALSISYMRAEYAVRRSYRQAERANTLRLRELYGTGSKTQAPCKGRAQPLSSTAMPHVSLNAVMHRSLPVHVRFVYRTAGWTDRDARRSNEARGN
jgi:hypothetical protein